MRSFLFKPRFSRWELIFVILVPVTVGQTWGGAAWLAAFAFGCIIEWVWGDFE